MAKKANRDWEKRDSGAFRAQFFPLIDEPLVPTLDRKLVIGVAPVGAFVTKDVLPTVPDSPAEIIAAAKDCFEAGASFVHIHCKTEDGVLSVDPQLTVDTLQPIREQCPGVIVSGNLADRKEFGDRRLFAEPLEEVMRLDPDIFDTYTLQTASRTHWKVTRDGLRDQVACLEAHGIKPELQCPTLHGPQNVRRWLIDAGALRMPPYFVNMHLGKSDAIPTNVGEPLATRLVLDSLEMIPEGCTRGLFPCGRNWLPVAMAGLTQGLDFIRVGYDDAVYLHPHRDDLAPSTAEMVRRVVRIAEYMGIEIATPAEARGILGIPARGRYAHDAAPAAAAGG